GWGEAMAASNTNPRYGMGRVCLWSLGYARRHPRALAGVLAAMLLKVGLDVLKPWPLKVLIDHVVGDRPMSEGIARSVGLLPGAGTPEGLLTWCVAGTVLLFVLTWAAGLGVALANLGCGQRMVYDLQADLFGHMQRLSLRFHSRKPVGDLV